MDLSKILQTAKEGLAIMKSVNDLTKPGSVRMEAAKNLYSKYFPENKVSPEELQEILQKGYEFYKAIDKALDTTE